MIISGWPFTNVYKVVSSGSGAGRQSTLLRVLVNVSATSFLFLVCHKSPPQLLPYFRHPRCPPQTSFIASMRISTVYAVALATAAGPAAFAIPLDAPPTELGAAKGDYIVHELARRLDTDESGALSDAVMRVLEKRMPKAAPGSGNPGGSSRGGGSNPPPGGSLLNRLGPPAPGQQPQQPPPQPSSSSLLSRLGPPPPQQP
ncbi:hypothetical protein K474DRAFT_185273 [Panus rudis PR-1116 ss-1]|nr:hypothetical protein K474DRAFT_185273 [Panus rudis PR-1116 ss-1]